MGLLDSIAGFVDAYGDLGVLLVALIGNMIPYSTVPYLVLIAAYATRFDSAGKYIAITLAGALGAALGKVVVYMMGRAARRKISAETRENLEVFVGAFKRSAFLAVFLFAALPLPDDIVYVPMGVAGYSLKHFFAAVFLGKTIITGFSVFAGRTLGMLMELGAAYNPWLVGAALIVGILMVTIAIIEMDWAALVKRYADRGAKEGFIEFSRQLFLLLTFRSPRRYYRRRKRLGDEEGPIS